MPLPSPPMTWDPTQYLAFADHRLRPAQDLGHVASAAPEIDDGSGKLEGDPVQQVDRRPPA